MSISEKKYLTTEEVAEISGFAKGTLENWRCQAKGPCYLKVGHSVRYLASEVEKWLEKYQMQTFYCMASK